jgi:predicted DNA binding CopG/RHH family protein
MISLKFTKLKMIYSFAPMKIKTMKPKKKTGGRKKKYGEKTKSVAFRLPESKIAEIRNHVKSKMDGWAK